MARKQRNAPQFWTRAEIKKLLKMWDTQTLDQIASELGRNKVQVQSMVKTIRKEGYDLPSKRSNGVDRKMVKDVLKELNLI